MKVKNAILVLNGNDIKEVLNTFVNTEGIKINKIKFTKENIQITGSIKKIFTLDFSCNIGIISVNKDKVTIKIKDIKALKINLFSVIEKVITGRGSKLSLGNYLSIDKDLININLDILRCKLKGLDFELQDINVIKEGIEIKFDYIDIKLMVLLEKNFKNRKEKMVN
ncbi:MAG: hypothetical protein ACRDCW_16755 [Sarcina sp.]